MEMVHRRRRVPSAKAGRKGRLGWAEDAAGEEEDRRERRKLETVRDTNYRQTQMQASKQALAVSVEGALTNLTLAKQIKIRRSGHRRDLERQKVLNSATLAVTSCYS